MPRVLIQRKSTRGAELACGKCKDPIEPGTEYRKWSFFRQRTPHVRCMKPECAPRPSELTQSLLSNVLGAYEVLEDAVSGDFCEDDAQSAADDLQSAAEETAGEYEAAAEAFNGEGPNQERADALNDFANEIDLDLSGEPGTVEDELKEGAHDDELREWADWRDGIRTQVEGLEVPSE